MAAALGLAALQPWDPNGGDGGRGTWVAIQQTAMVGLVVLAWQTHQLTGVRDRFVARMVALGVASQLVMSVWNNQLGGSYQWYGSTLDDGIRTTLTVVTGVAAVAALSAMTGRRDRTAGHDVAAVVDASVVSMAVGIVVWESLSARMDVTGMTVVAIATATVIVVASTAVFIRLLLSSARRVGAVRLLALTLVCGAAGTLRFALDAVAGLPPRDTWWELAVLLTLALFVAALLHPSMGELLDGVGGGSPDVDGDAFASEEMLRATILCVATVAPAVVALVRALSAVRETSGAALPTTLTVPSAAAGVAITVGVAWRLAQLVRDRERARALLEQRSRHDDLTGLPNRAYLLERLDREIRRVRAADQSTDAGFGLMFLDLDGFKAINDNYGHHAGDAVLVAVGQRLADAVRTDDFVARMAGDEFVLLCADPADEPSLTRLAGRVRAAIEAPLPADFGVVTPRVSIGVAAADRTLATSTGAVNAILRRADDEMYAAKHDVRTATTGPPPPAPRPGSGRPGPPQQSETASDIDRVG